MSSTRYSCQILINLELQIFFKKKACVLNFVKIRSVVAELFHADEQADMTKLIVAFRNFANVPEKQPPPPPPSITHTYAIQWKVLHQFQHRYKDTRP
jgi:hypothetical protein